MPLFGKSAAKKQAIKDGFENVKKVKKKKGELVFPEGADKVEIKEQGWCLCSFASKHGFLDCKYLREINTHLADKTTLRKGDFVAVPKKREKTTSDKDGTVVKAKRPQYPPPMVWFIKEDGVGYVNPPIYADDDTGKPKVQDRHFPKRTGLDQLGITNYHVDKTNEGTQDFADKRKYENDEHSSKDPDHFKVQVYDNSVPDGTDEVKVTLLAMRPSYRKKKDGRIEVFVEQTTNYREPASDTRKTEVTCKRITDTNYFRSPYLRLVTTETDHDARPKQTLLVTDYWDDGDGDTGAGKDKTGVIEKYFSEILHQKVRASYSLDYCKPKKCKILKDAKLEAKREVHLAIHILTGSTATLAQAREQIYKWMRRCLAQTNVRPHLKILRKVEVPKNMITISDENGKYATGKDKADANKASYLQVTVDGNDYRFPATGKTWGANKSPRASASGLKAVLQAAGLKVDGTHPVKVDGLSLTMSVGAPQDMLIFKSDGKTAADVTSVKSTDQNQTVIHTNDINIELTIDDPYQKRKTRAVWRRWKTDYFDMFVGGADIYLDGGTACWGVGQTGDYSGSKYDMGPSCVLCADALDPAQKLFNSTHELLHALMHTSHTSDDPAIGKYEIMKSATTGGADTKDATKHISDGPNKVEYEIFHGTSMPAVTLDGSEHVFLDTTITHTPTTRFRIVGSHYGLLKRPSQRRLNDEEDRG